VQKVLIVTYYWPPSGGSGVQRWLKFIKYLRKFDIEPVVYTPKNPDISLFDTSLQKDIPNNLTVLQRRIFEPYALFRLFARRKTNFGVGFTSFEGHPPNRFTRLSIWIRGNCFIPDPRVLWVKPSIRFLKEYICKNGIVAIVTTGPPHSMHLIGMALKKKLNIAWVADFRDPWTNIDFIDNLKLNSRSLAKHLHLEKQVVESADCVVVVSPQMKKDFEGYKPKQVEVITNGFDADDFPKNVQKLDEQFTITHVGTIPPNRNCPVLWNVLSEMAKADEEFSAKLSIQLVGNVDSSVINSIKSEGLINHCKFLGYVTHEEGIRLMQRSQILLLLVNNSPNASGILTGKVFEYLAAKRPILAIAPSGGDLDNLLTATGSGMVASFANSQAIKDSVQLLWYQYKLSLTDQTTGNIDEYSREHLTKRLAQLISNLTKHSEGQG